MKVIIRPTEKAAIEFCAQFLADMIRAKPSITLGLATGGTMEKLYARLAEMHKKNKLDFSLAKSFNLDEYVGLSPKDKNSYRYYMNHHLFDKINIDKRNTHVLDGLCDDPIEEGENYEAMIEESGGLDVQLLGIGLTGHIAFNEPLSSFASRTRCETLTPTTLKQNGGYFGGIDKMPRQAMTMGVGTILEARTCLMLALGKSKADIIAKAVEGPITPMISATALHFHDDAIVVLDKDAAAKLKNKEYYEACFETESDWENYR